MTGIIMIIVIALLIDFADVTHERKVQRNTEAAHKKAYDAIDKAYGNTLEAREYKAKLDVLVERELGKQGREYKPEHLEQVTTAKERKERAKYERDGIKYYSEPVINSIAKNIAYDKNFEYFVEQRMRVFKCTREEAEEIVRRNFEADGITRS